MPKFGLGVGAILHIVNTPEVAADFELILVLASHYASFATYAFGRIDEKAHLIWVAHFSAPSKSGSRSGRRASAISGFPCHFSTLHTPEFHPDVPSPVATCSYSTLRSEEHTSELQSLMRSSY